MSINQINPELNDAFETYFPQMGVLWRFTFRVFTKIVQFGIKFRRTAFGGTQLVNERVVEYPLILKWLDPELGKVLDIGCWSSRLPIQLASLGYEVHGLDVQEYHFQHPNLYFHRADLFECIPEYKFDSIIAISVIEHIGIGNYGDTVIQDGDIKAVEKISTFLKEKGQFLVSMPFGKAGLTPKHRIYDLERLKQVFQKYDFINEAYFQRIGKDWLPTTAERLRNVESLELPPNGVVVLNLRLKKV